MNFIKTLFISFCFLLSIPHFLSFDCSAIDELGCSDFTYNGTFLKTPEERVQALNNFYQKYSNDDQKRSLTFELDSEKRIFIKTHEEIPESKPIFTFNKSKIVAQISPISMDFSFFEDELSRFRYHLITVSARIGQSKYWKMKDRAILLFWMHIAQRNDSIIGDYLNTLDEEIFSPYLQFGDDELDILKNLNEDYSNFLNTKRNHMKYSFTEFQREFYTYYTREIAADIFRYSSPEVNLKLSDYLFAEFFLEKSSFVHESEHYYIIPFLDLIKEEYSSNRNYLKDDNIRIGNIEQDKIAYFSDFEQKENSAISKNYRKTLERLFVIDGTFDKNHVLECEKIPLWEGFSGGFTMTVGHANLIMYLPFPNFQICYRDPAIDNIKITLLVRLLNMKQDQANDCYIKAKEFDKIRGLSGKEFYEELEKACYKPELKLNSKDIAKIEIDAKIAKYNLILEKIQKLIEKKQENKIALRNFSFLKNYATFKLELFSSALQHLNSLPFIVSELDLKQKKLNQEKAEEMMKNIKMEIIPNNEEGVASTNQETKENEENTIEEDEDFKLDEKTDL